VIPGHLVGHLRLAQTRRWDALCINHLKLAALSLSSLLGISLVVTKRFFEVHCAYVVVFRLHTDMRNVRPRRCSGPLSVRRVVLSTASCHPSMFAERWLGPTHLNRVWNKTQRGCGENTRRQGEKLRSSDKPLQTLSSLRPMQPATCVVTFSCQSLSTESPFL